jgi:hypothetical protein
MSANSPVSPSLWVKPRARLDRLGASRLDSSRAMLGLRQDAAVLRVGRVEPVRRGQAEEEAVEPRVERAAGDAVLLQLDEARDIR